MSLLSPKPGEIIDRLSILELKIEKGGKMGKSTTHFEAEKASLQEVLSDWDMGLIDSYSFSMDEELKKVVDDIAIRKNALAAINALIWDAEDGVRNPESDYMTLANLAKNIALWNDARASHIRKLDALFGVPGEPEKLYEGQG